jgi:hypothetical protein
MTNRPVILLLVIGVFFLVSCNDDRDEPAEIVDENSIYLDYLAWGDEESNTVTLKMQYRAGGRNQKAIELKEPARVEFDGQVISPDSSRFNGPYYEVIRPATEFAGPHRIVFTAIDGKKYTTDFDFSILALKPPVPDSIHRDDLILELSGVKPGDRIWVLLNDTSYYGPGIEILDTTAKGIITISKEEFRGIKNGPVQIELIREESRMPDETMPAGGRFYLTYSIKKELMLIDSAR